MVRRIDAAAGIAIDVPGAAELVVLLDDGVGNAETPECNSKRDGADPGPDDQDMLLRKPLVRRTMGPARLARDKSHLFAHQRRIFRGDVFAEAGAHHLEHQLISGVDNDGRRIAIREQFEYRGADILLDFPGHAGVGIGDQADVALGLVGRFQPALVAGHVHQHHQQDADVALGDGRGQIKLLARYLDVHVCCPR